MYKFLLLIQQIPGIQNGIPGIDKQYIPEQGMAAAAALFDKMNYVSYLLLVPLLGIAYLVTVVKLRENIGVGPLLTSTLLVLLLLQVQPYYFGTVMRSEE